MSESVGSSEVTKDQGWSINLTSVHGTILKLIGACFIAFAIWHWYQIIGFADDGIRFDTMPDHLKIVSVALAVLQPVVAIGLWAAFPWGIAVWAIAALIELLMYGYYENLFGSNDLLVIFHIGCAIAMLVLQVLLRYAKKNAKAGIFRLN